MKPQKQLFGHNPSKKVFGDCYRTCIAVILDRNACDVPHVCDAKHGDDVCGVHGMREYLRKEGMTISKSLYNGNLSFMAFKRCMKQFNPDTAMVVTGQRGKGGVNHCIVMVGDKVVCDPITGEPDQDALSAPATVDGESYWWVEVVTKSEAMEIKKKWENEND